MGSAPHAVLARFSQLWRGAAGAREQARERVGVGEGQLRWIAESGEGRPPAIAGAGADAGCRRGFDLGHRKPPGGIRFG
jgi:hypothetical protein